MKGYSGKILDVYVVCCHVGWIIGKGFDYHLIQQNILKNGRLRDMRALHVGHVAYS